MNTPSTRRLATGVPNLDTLLHGGLPQGSMCIVAGPPGSGKTILAQQIGFSLAASGHTILYFHTLSEPTAKTLVYLSAFGYFDPQQLGARVTFVDLGIILRHQGLEPAVALIMDRVQQVGSSVVIIDSFKVFDDLAKSPEALRKFGYEIAVNLMAWECTTLLLGEYASVDYETNPLFSIADGLFVLTQRYAEGEPQRFLRIIKVRGTDHSRDEHPFAISNDGIAIFAPAVTSRREPGADTAASAMDRCRTGISGFDDLLGEGIPRGSSVLVSGVAGTGKTVMLLEFAYRGAEQFGERGIVFSFEETEERLRATGRGLGWEKLDRLLAAGLIELVLIPQPDIIVERDLAMIRERVAAMGARRVAVDSVSVFLHKTQNAEVARERVFQLATIVQNAGAVGLFATDIAYGSAKISRFGVEETVVDGVVLLSSTEKGLERERYLEVYKLRNTAHLVGRHSLSIGKGGVRVFPRYECDPQAQMMPPALESGARLSTGIGGLDAVLSGGVLARSATVVSGSAGVGKSTLGLQFLAAGAAHEECGLFISLEEGPAQVRRAADALGLPLTQAIERGIVELLYFPLQTVRPAQLLTVLTERIDARRTRRLVLDGASQIPRIVGVEATQLLFNLIARFKVLDVSSVLTFDSKSLYAFDTVSDGGLSPMADNLIVMRYVQRGGVRERALAVVKTRASAHGLGTYSFQLARGGIQLDPQSLVPETRVDPPADDEEPP